MFGVHFRFRFISFATADLFPTNQDIVVICFSLSLVSPSSVSPAIKCYATQWSLFIIHAPLSPLWRNNKSPGGNKIDIHRSRIWICHGDRSLLRFKIAPIPLPITLVVDKNKTTAPMLHFGNSIWSRDVNVDIQNFALYIFLFSLSVCRSIGPWALASSSLDDVFFNFIIIWPLVAFPFPKKRKWSVMFVGCLRVTIWHISNSCDGVRFVRGRVRREVERINVIIWCENNSKRKATHRCI